MSNTVIQIKRSLTSGTPASLNVAELAYSYASNTFFIGTPDGTGTIAIGGKSFLDLINLTFNTANAAYLQANSTSSAYEISNTIGAAANSWANTVAAAGNSYMLSVATAGNNFTVSVGTAGNSYAEQVGTAGNNYASILAANNAVGANAWASAVGTAGNNYTDAVGVAGNNYTNAVGVAGNNYTDYVGASANSYTNATYVKLTATQQTITGDLAITGNLTFSGNTTFLDSQTLEIGDSLIYLAANNYSGTDIIDIGFVANYGNNTGANVHTGLVRDATNKQYYLFQGLDIEPTDNNITPYANNMVNAILNADLIADSVTVSGMNVYPWVSAAFNTANSSNGWANTVGAAGNNYTDHVGLSVNTYVSILAANNAVGANAWASAVGVAGNNYTDFVGAAGNNYAIAVGAASNAWASAVGVASNSYADSVGSAGNNYMLSVTTAGNNYLNTVNTHIFNTFHDAANLTSGTVSTNRISGSYTGITGVGTITVGTWNGNTVNVAHGGTGITSATLNGVLFGGGGSSPIQITAAGTEGSVLTASSSGVPQFEMLSGGTF